MKKGRSVLLHGKRRSFAPYDSENKNSSQRCFFVLFIGNYSHSSEKNRASFADPIGNVSAKEGYKIIEGKGIQGVAALGEPIRDVQRIWGNPNLVTHDDWPYSPYDFYEYHKKGVLFTTRGKGQRIVNMTFYLNSESAENYMVFQGRTARGLILKNTMSEEEVYKVYGKPKQVIFRSSNLIQKKIKNGEPFIIDDGKVGLSIHYPNLQLSFRVQEGLIETCGMGYYEVEK